MSQAGQAGSDGTIASDVETLTGNSGGAVGPDALYNINIVGSGGINVVGSPGTNTLTIEGDIVQGITNVSSSPYTVLSTDEYLSVDCSGGAIILQFPNSTTDGRRFVVKDATGSSSSFNITVTTVGGAVNIDGATSYLLVNNYDAIDLIWNNTTGAYEVF